MQLALTAVKTRRDVLAKPTIEALLAGRIPVAQQKEGLLPGHGINHWRSTESAAAAEEPARVLAFEGAVD